MTLEINLCWQFPRGKQQTTLSNSLTHIPTIAFSQQLTSFQDSRATLVLLVKKQLLFTHAGIASCGDDTKHLLSNINNNLSQQVAK